MRCELTQGRKPKLYRIVQTLKSGRLEWAEHVFRMVEFLRVCLDNLQEGPRHRWVDNKFGFGTR